MENLTKQKPNLVFYSFRINIYNILIVLFLLCTYTGTLFAQRIINIGIQISPGFSFVSAKLPDELTEKKTKGDFAINFGITGQYFLDKKYGISSGIQLLSFKQTSTGNEYFESFDDIDTDNQSYERRVWGKDILEKTSIRLIHLPIHFFYVHPLNKAIAMYGSIGPGISISIQKKYTGSGMFTYKGYYPEDGVVLHDIPVYGFNTDVSVNTNENLRNRSVIFDVGASLGCSFAINRYYKFHTSLNYFRSISKLAKDNESYHLSSELGSFNSFLYNGKNNLNNLFFSIGITKDILY